MRKHRGYLAVGLALILSPGLKAAAPVEGTCSTGVLCEYVLLVKGQSLPSLAGADLKSLNLAAVRGGHLEAIPFQVDEVCNGEHVFAWVIPFDFNSVLSSFEIRGTLLLDPKVLPLTYYDVSHRSGVKIDGVPDAPAGPLTGGDARDWCVISGKGMSLFFITHFPEAWNDKLKRRSFVDDRPGKSEVGSVFGEMVDLLDKGLHTYMVRFYVLPAEFQWGNEKRIEDMAGSKPRITGTVVP